MDRILIPGIPLRVRVGVPEDERAVEQDVRIALTLHLDLSRAGASDDLSDTVDYDAVCAVVTEAATKRPFRLIEAIAEEVAAAVLGDFGGVAEVDVGIEKPGALQDRGIPFAAVEITRRRDA